MRFQVALLRGSRVDLAIFSQSAACFRNSSGGFKVSLLANFSSRTTARLLLAANEIVFEAPASWAGRNLPPFVGDVHIGQPTRYREVPRELGSPHGPNFSIRSNSCGTVPSPPAAQGLARPRLDWPASHIAASPLLSSILT